jgi:hypothetical protein
MLIPGETGLRVSQNFQSNSDSGRVTALQTALQVHPSPLHPTSPPLLHICSIQWLGEMHYLASHIRNRGCGLQQYSNRATLFALTSNRLFHNQEFDTWNGTLRCYSFITNVLIFLSINTSALHPITKTLFRLVTTITPCIEICKAL